MLESLGIVIRDRENNEYHPTSGGLLLFGVNPQIYMPHCSIKIVNKVKQGFEQVKAFSGPILEMLGDAEKYVKDVIDSSTYPVDAVYEALANAVAYRDYFDIYHEIVVLMLNRSLQIINPGSLVKNYGSNTYGVNIPSKRNMWLYQRLITMDYSNRFSQTGGGFKRMKQAFNGHGRVRFLNIEDKNVFKVIFPGIDSFKKSTE
jgi:predicted HTH transcriptional regulator